MSKFFNRILVLELLFLLSMTIYAQQLTNANFEDWSGTAFDGNVQPKGWNASNVTQFGFKFNFAHRETGHNGGYCMMVQDQDVGAAGITETSPGYFSLGQPWVYVASLTAVSQASAGTYGGINWTYRPDSMSVWIRRVGDNTSKEDFYLLYYSWTGTAKSNKYKGKNGNCTTTDTYTDEESDIRQALDGNECGTTQKATQIAEGMWRERATYNNWTNIRVPIYYMNDNVPQKMNIIFSASNYPNFRANSGLYAGNSLYVDDIQLVYSSKIQKLYIDDIEWKGFDPNSTAVQEYSLGQSATAIPKIEAKRGAGSLTNAHGTTVSFAGRTLSGSEINIVKGDLENTPTVITVTAGDGGQTVYRIQFKKALSSNTKLSGITVNGQPLEGFSPAKYTYSVDLPYGTTAAPVVEAEGQEARQTISVTQATSVTGTATIHVTAANGTSKMDYVLNFQVGKLADNELADIQVNGNSIPGFTPSQTIYKVSLPVTTTVMPVVTAISKYPAGEQTVVHTAPATIDGGTYQLSVTTPGNPIAKVYKLNFKLEKSSYSYLRDLQVEGGYITNFEPDNFTYYINLPMGTHTLPAITTVPGDEYQEEPVISSLGEGVVDGTVRITVTAGNGDQSVYKLVFATEKSDVKTLSGIKIGGELMEGFVDTVFSYTYELPVGTTELPIIEVIPGDEYQKPAVITTAGVNGKTRITVTADDGSTSIYQIAFSVKTFSDNKLASLAVDGFDIGFDPEVNEYWVNLTQGTKVLPEVTYTLRDVNFQTAVPRAITGLNGDYKITVRPESGASRTYIIHFSVATSSNVKLSMIYVGGEALASFDADTVSYTITLPEGVSKVPAVTFDKAESSQRVLSVLDGTVQTITVTAQSGATRVYTLTFIITVSENALLDMIYLDGDSLSGFRRDSLTYEVPLSGATCPEITVDKAAGQQVTITAPYAAGVAQIKVLPEFGSATTYEITFKAGATETVRLDGIQINGEALNTFVPTELKYERDYIGSLPTVEGVAAAGQTVQVQWKGETAYLFVSDAEGNKAVYTVAFTRQLRSNKALKAILIDGTPLTNFDPEVLHYDSLLEAGSTYPEVSYEAEDEAQVVFFGQIAEGKWGISVAAEDGSVSTYTVQFSIKPHTEVTLEDLEVEGFTIAFNEDQEEYNGLSIDEGKALPRLAPRSRAGQKVVAYTLNDTTQQVVVRAENGDEKTYTIHYDRVRSNNAKLEKIYIDGVAMSDFDPDQTAYTITLPRGRQTVPNVFPVGQLDNQTITTTYSRPNGVTTIHVVAQDGTGEMDYTIAFPVEKSDNTVLKSLMIDGISRDVETTEYIFNVPFDTISPYSVSFERQDGQTVHLIEAPLDEETQIIVTSEKGDSSRTYSIRYNVAQPQGENKVTLIRYTYETASGQTVNGQIEDPALGENIVSLPYGAMSFSVTAVEKNYPEQSVLWYDGGIRRGAKITAVANRAGEEDVVYTITPEMPAFDTKGKLMTLKYKNKDVPNFRPDVYNYIINVTAQPTAKDFTVKAYNNKGLTFSAFDAKKKQVTITVASGEKYSICWYYENDKDPFDLSGGWELADKGTGMRPNNGWKVIADYSAGYNYSLVGYNIPYVTGKETAPYGSNGVMLSTMRQGALMTTVPGMMTLGEMYDVNFTKSGNSVTRVRENATVGLQFRNTPEQLKVDYNAMRSTGIDKWRIWVTLSDGTNYQKIDSSYNYSDNPKSGTKIINLVYPANAMQVLNATLNSCKEENAGDMSGYGDNNSADLVLQNMHLVYNSALTGATVNGKTTTPSGKTFVYNVPANEVIMGTPALKFTGAVHDQMQTIEWLHDGEWVNGKLTARVINYGENSLDSTHYYVELRRTPVTSIQYSTTMDPSYAQTQKGDTLFVDMPFGTKVLPDVTITPESPHQQVTMDKKGNVVTVKVTAENGADSTTVYVFRETKAATLDFASALTAEDSKGNDVPLQTVDADNYIYKVVAEQMPTIIYSKLYGQLVEVHYTADQVTIIVTAQNGDQRTYTINREDEQKDTKAQIEDFVGISGLGGDTYEVTAKRPTEPVLFTRSDSTDLVVFIQTPLMMEWQVIGSTNHTYTLTYPTSLSANDTLAMIQVNGVDYTEYRSYDTDYNLNADTVWLVTPVASENAQTITTTQTAIEGGIEYTIEVKAQNSNINTYRVRVAHKKSNDATLAGIMLDSVLIDDFDPATASYNVTLPVGDVKTEEPQLPNITYLAGHKGQTVAVEPGQLNGDPFVFTVTGEDGVSSKYYTLQINAAQSRCVDLTGISVNGAPIDHFEAGRHYYSVSVPSTEIGIDYTTNDRFQTVDTIIEVLDETGRRLQYTLRVHAEHGEMADYAVAVYVENQSSDHTLANITLDGKNFSDFERALNADLTFNPDNNNYTINLPSGTTVLPEVSAQLKMEGQTVDIEHRKDSVLLNVTAVDGSTNQYVLHFLVPMSKNADLSMIFLNGDSLPDFRPDYYFYQITLPVGTHSLPEVVAQKGEAMQTLRPVQIDEDKLQATIKVQPEDPSMRENTYVVVFHYSQSDADTLSMIYQDGKPLANFDPKNMYYALSLPVGTTVFPDLSWAESDEWQTIDSLTVEQSADKMVRQIRVTSESGKKNTYTVSYTILKSTVDTLQTLFVSQKQLTEFKADILEYYYELTASEAAELNDQVPTVEYIAGDEYQTVLVSQVRDSISGKSLGYKSIITVTAASGATRTYAIHYPVQKSSEATLNMINLGGKPLANYDAERFNYKVEIETDASIPVVTVIKKEEIQIVEISIDDQTVIVEVTAEDGSKGTYTLVFDRVKSANASLRNIILRDETGEKLPAAVFPYIPEEFSYTINLNFDPQKTVEQQLPTIETVAYDTLQTVDTAHYALPNGDMRVDITVTAANGENQAIYSLVFHFVKATDAALTAITIKDEALEGFASDITEYAILHPFGTTEEDFVTADDVQATLSDPLATITITDGENGTIFIRVVAQDGTTENTYSISQEIARDNDCTLSAILLDGVELRDFDSQTTFYTYYLPEGSTTTPLVEAVTTSDLATVSIREVSAGDTCTIVCVADDGSTMRYYVHFALSTVNEALVPTSNDVIAKRMPGTNQLFVGTIRKDVFFVLMDENGRLLFHQQVPTANPNDVEVTVDVETQERLSDISDPNSGLVIDLQPQKVYYYTFLYGDKTFIQMIKGDNAKKLKSGKLVFL